MCYYKSVKDLFEEERFMQKDFYIPLSLNSKNNDGSIQKWYCFRGSNGTFIVGIKQNEVKSTKAFNFPEMSI